VISEVGKSSLVSLNLLEVKVIAVKSDPLGTVESTAAPLQRTVTVVFVRGFALASSTRPVAPLIVAVSTSTVCSELCKKPVGAVSPNVSVTPKAVGMVFSFAGRSPL